MSPRTASATEPAAGRTGSPAGLAGTRLHRRVPLVAAVLAALVGLIDVAEVVTPGVYSRIRAIDEVMPGAVIHAAVAVTGVVGVLLLLLARGLRRRKHRAWVAAVAVLGVSAVFHVVKGYDVGDSALTVAMLAVLVVFRREFYAVGDPRTRVSGLMVLPGLVLLSLGIGLLALRLRSPFRPPHPLGAQLREVLWGLVGLNGPLTYTSARSADLVSDLLAGLGVLIALVTAYLVLRPPEPPGRLSRDDEGRLRELLARHGARDSLGYFALRWDKNVVFSPTGKAAVTFRVYSGVMLASGDPIGDPEAWPGAIAAFLEEAYRHAWTPAVVGCSEQGGEVWARHGLGALELGDEAVVELAEFSLEGRAMRNVRQAVARVERAGYVAVVRRVRDIPAAERTAIRDQAAAWRQAPTERGFSMALGRFGDPADGDCVAVQAVKDGRMRALLHFVPWGEDGLSLDLMRRDRSADNGLNEFLIVATLRAAEELGLRRISLNFAVFRSALERGERLGAGPVLRGWRSLLLFASRWFQIESLYRFNAKFRPVWEPRFVCFPTARDLPRIALAALEAEAFIVWPRLRLRWPGSVRPDRGHLGQGHAA